MDLVDRMEVAEVRPVRRAQWSMALRPWRRKNRKAIWKSCVHSVHVVGSILSTLSMLAITPLAAILLSFPIIPIPIRPVR
jgi:hypothetical protein